MDRHPTAVTRVRASAARLAAPPPSPDRCPILDGRPGSRVAAGHRRSRRKAPWTPPGGVDDQAPGDAHADHRHARTVTRYGAAWLPCHASSSPPAGCPGARHRPRTPPPRRRCTPTPSVGAAGDRSALSSLSVPAAMPFATETVADPRRNERVLPRNTELDPFRLEQCRCDRRAGTPAPRSPQTPGSAAWSSSPPRPIVPEQRHRPPTRNAGRQRSDAAPPNTRHYRPADNSPVGNLSS
jgi:hypothetical protein